MNDLISRRDALIICDKYYRKAHYEIVIEMLERLPAAERWIPVTERLPEDDVSVLVSYIGLTRDKEQYEGVTVASYDSDFEGWYRDNDFAAVVVTAWQPLPEPYKGGTE